MIRLAASIVAAGVLAGVVPAPSDLLVAAQTMGLPSVNGRIDHLAFDTAGGRLFIAALGNNTVEVVDVASGRRVKSLSGFHEPQGIAVVPEHKLAAIANGAGEGVQFVDAVQLTAGKTVKIGDDSDNVRYDAGAKTLYVGYGGGGLAAVNPADGSVPRRLPLPGHPESFQLETSGPRIFVNVPDARQIVVIDRAAAKAVATWPVTTASANFPMALDETGHRLFVGCRQPAMLLVYDTQTGKETASAPIVGDTDDLFYDAARQRVYVIGGEGFVDVLDVRSAPARLARVATAAGARTGLFVPSLSRLFVAVPHRGAQAAEIRVFEAK